MVRTGEPEYLQNHSYFLYCMDCVAEICHGINIYALKLNRDKADILLIHSRYRDKPLVNEFNIKHEKVPITATLS